MVTAYVMIKANTGEADRLQRAVADIEGVINAHVVAGDVDVIAKLDVPDPAAVKRVAADEIQRVDGVEDTQTYVAME